MLVNLKAEMARCNVEVGDIALVIGQHRNTVSNKISEKRSFTVPEAVEIKEKFFPDLSIDYLFTSDSNEHKCKTD